MVLASVLITDKVFAADAVTLTYEYAASVEGPWRAVDPAAVQISPTGAVTVQTDAGPNALFRLRVVSSGGESSTPVVTLAQVPEDTLVAARTHLAHLMASGDTEFGGQLGEVDFAPFAAPLVDTTDGKRPSHFEFKFLRKIQPSAKSGFRKFDSEETGDNARGYMVCSADKNDLPVVEFSTEGGTPVESLLRKCGNVTPSKIIRFGAAFWVAENERGELVANHGTEPFRPPLEMPELARQAPIVGNGDTETEVHDVPPPTRLMPSFYRNYGEFKADIGTNDFYKTLRARRTENAKPFWNAERGVFPEVLQVARGETRTFLPGVQIDNIIEDTESGERAIANVAKVARLGGFSVQGVAPGRMAVKVRVNEAVTHYVIEVPATRAGAEPTGKKGSIAQAGPPFWKTITEAYAGGWADQMRWWQLKDSDWCQAVGCGPAALGMMLGWWENKKGVESAFYTAANDFTSISTVDAPQFLDTNAKKARVKKAYALLHDYCDVICDPFSDAGATLPGDLIEGFFDYIHPVSAQLGVSSILYGKGKPLVGYSYSYAYDFWGDDWDSSGSRVANGIKSGRPGVVGLGWLWHYVVAYGYLRQDYTQNINGQDVYMGLRKRFFKVNEGWGKENPAWYSAYDVFLGLSVSMFQKTVPTLP
jgi:hypothetical protein